MKVVGVLTSGGDCPGMNACIHFICKKAIELGYEVIGFIDGFKGIVESNYMKLTTEITSVFKNRGGTFLHTLRYPEFESKSVQLKAVENLKKLNISDLICIGGDGTSRGAKSLTDLGIRTIMIPATIDNDVFFSDFSIGFYTACFNATNSVNIINDTFMSHHRFGIVEVMGRYCGDICKKVCIDTDSILAIPYEDNLDLDKYTNIIVEKVKDLDHGMFIISEHLCDIKKYCEKLTELTHKEFRHVMLGYIQRGGSPVSEDFENSRKFGEYSMEIINNNELKDSYLIGLKNYSLCLSTWKE